MPYLKTKMKLLEMDRILCFFICAGFAVAACLISTTGISTAKEPFPLVITDMADRQVVIRKPVRRVVTTFKPASLCLLSLGFAHTLVGVDNSSRKDPLQLAVWPQIADLPEVGTKSMGISLETVISLKPDLVIFYSQNEGFASTDRLSAMGIPCIVIIPESFDSIKQAMGVIAMALEAPDTVHPVIRQMDDILALVHDRLTDLPESLQKTGYFASPLGLFSTPTGNMLQNEIFSKAGIRSVSSHLTGYFQDISPEQLVKWNPDLMIVSQHMKNSQLRFLDLATLQGITAISQKSVYRCPSSLAPWDFPSPLAVLATLWVAQKAYPDKFSDIDIHAYADHFHQHLFGKTMTRMGGILEDVID